MIALSAGPAALVLAPEAGGAILGWRIGRDPVLRPPGPEAALGLAPRAMGAFPLLPFSNRIGGGGFVFDGRRHAIARADPSFPTPIHGIGWVRRWEAVDVAADAARLRLCHPAHPAELAFWPFAFEAELAVRLAADSLRLSLRLVNRAPGQAPAGIGLHPYFPRPRGARLRFAARAVWRADAARLPLGLGDVPEAWDHRAGLAVGEVALDDVFAGWDGSATLTLGERTVTLSADPVFGHLVVFVPAAADVFCVEPVSHATDALNRPEPAAVTGLRVLAPGEALEGTIRIAVAPG